MQAPPKYSPVETARRAEEWYAKGLRQQLETEENLGKILAIDIDTGVYALADNVPDAADAMKKKMPDADLFMLRVGYPSVYKIGGRLQPERLFDRNLHI